MPGHELLSPFDTRRDRRFVPSWSMATQWWWVLPLSIPAQIRFIVLQTIVRAGPAADDLAGMALRSDLCRAAGTAAPADPLEGAGLGPCSAPWRRWVGHGDGGAVALRDAGPGGLFLMAGGWTGHWPGVGDHVRETHPGADIAEALRLVPHVAFPPVDCADVAEPVARYGARTFGA